MELIDLTHIIEAGMPVFPGTEPPEIRQANTIGTDGFAEKILQLYSHTGTHMDAPAHIFENGKTLDAYPVEHFFGKAFVPDLKYPLGGVYEKNDFRTYEDQIRSIDYMLINTGWSRHWGRPAYFKSYPVLSLEAAEYLASFPLKGVGFDAISADPMEDLRLSNHRALLGKGMVLIENLKNLEKLKGRGRFLFSCMPLKILEADGSPIRAAAIFSE